MSLDQTASAITVPAAGFDPLEIHIMEQRARRLATPAAMAGHDTTYSVLIFRIGAESYGLDLSFIAQVVKAGSLVPVPGARPPFAGLLNLRGEIVSAFSLGQVIGQPQKPISEQTRAIVCGTANTRFALLADEVMQAMSVRSGEMAPPTQSAALASCTRGITASGIVVLEGAALAGGAGPLFAVPVGTPEQSQL